MSIEQNSGTLAPIRITGLTDTLCFQNIQELLTFLQTNAFAEVPDDVTNVHVSNVQPTSTNKSDMWVRLSSSGTFVGIYMYNGTTWKQVLPIPQGIFWMYGDSDDIPAGFMLVDGSNPHFTAPEVTHIQLTFYPTPGTPPYTYFAVTWEGF